MKMWMMVDEVFVERIWREETVYADVKSFRAGNFVFSL